MLFLNAWNQNWFDILNALTDLIVKVWSTGRAPFIPVERHLKALIGDKSEEELTHSIRLRSTDENIWHPSWGTLTPDPIHICDWAFRCDEKHKARPAGIRRKWCPTPYSNSCRPWGPSKRRAKNIEERIQEEAKAEQERLRAESRAEQELLQDRLMAEIEASWIAMEEHVQTNEELCKTNDELRKNLHRRGRCSTRKRSLNLPSRDDPKSLYHT